MAYRAGVCFALILSPDMEVEWDIAIEGKFFERYAMNYVFEAKSLLWLDLSALITRGRSEVRHGAN